MKINLNEVLYAFSLGLDAAEYEFLGTTPGHSKRIAALSIITGKAIGLTDNELIDIAAYSILHDNALTEFNQEEIEYKKYNGGRGYGPLDFMIRHCTIGEINTKLLPFRTNNRDVILLHHENADGSGPFRRLAQRTPIKAQIIHLGDMIDTHFNLLDQSDSNVNAIISYVRSNTGTLFSQEVSNAFCGTFKRKHLKYMTFDNIDGFLRSSIKHHEDEYTPQEVHNLATLIARIIDFKSHYTCKHSLGVATKAEKMAFHYNYSQEKTIRYYLAGALHDVGKLMIHNSILKKPSKLTDEEYMVMKNHAYYTHEILKGLKNMKDITDWASHHHEKLNGEGYPFRLNAKQLTQEERLMTCVDIYQALTEERPYKSGFPHQKTIQIMQEMVLKGELDGEIVEAVNVCFRFYHLSDQPSVTEILRADM
ncbi:MAG: HD domain-containing protein [Eubacterium sp.]|nr:HD domain-containing protein [Eubacterium sp.]